MQIYQKNVFSRYYWLFQRFGKMLQAPTFYERILASNLLILGGISKAFLVCNLFAKK